MNFYIYDYKKAHNQSTCFLHLHTHGILGMISQDEDSPDRIQILTWRPNAIRQDIYIGFYAEGTGDSRQGTTITIQQGASFSSQNDFQRFNRQLIYVLPTRYQLIHAFARKCCITCVPSKSIKRQRYAIRAFSFLGPRKTLSLAASKLRTSRWN